MLSLAFELQHFDIFLYLHDIDLVFFVFAVRYSLSPLTKRNHIGHIDGDDPPVSSSACERQPLHSSEQIRNDKLA